MQHYNAILCVYNNYHGILLKYVAFILTNS